MGTFFARVFAFNEFDAAVVGAATYVLPVPMGSPQSYYGVGFFQGVIPASTVTETDATDWLRPNATLSGSWTNPAAALVDDDIYATKYSGDCRHPAGVRLLRGPGPGVAPPSRASKPACGPTTPPMGDAPSMSSSTRPVAGPAPSA